MSPSHTAVTPRGFHTHGREFFAASEAVYALPKAHVLPLAFLWGRSIELLLKSYLLSVGLTGERLRSRKFGHNLVALYMEARQRGIDPLIGTDQVVPALMQLLNLEYGSKRLEYRETGTMYSIPDAAITRAVIRRLIKGVNFHLRQNGL